MAGNASFDLLVAFTSEKQLRRVWSSIWANDFPLLGMIRAKKIGYNTALEDPQGNSILLPINYLGPGTSARFGTRANAFTPITPNATQGFTQAQYFFSRLENAFYLDAAEKQLIAKNATTTRIPIIPGKINQLKTDFSSQLTTNLLGTQQGTGHEGNGQLTGEQYILSTSNSPGGISQTTYPAWAANVVTGVGTFYETLLDREIHRIKDLGRGKADFAQLSYTSTNDVYGKVYGLISPSQIIVDQAKSVLYGFETFSYRGLDCFQDGRLGDALAGSLVVGRSGSWYVTCKSEEPQLVDKDAVQRLQGTSSNEWFYDWWFTWGNDDPKSNTLMSGIT